MIQTLDEKIVCAARWFREPWIFSPSTPAAQAVGNRHSSTAFARVILIL